MKLLSALALSSSLAFAAPDSTIPSDPNEPVAPTELVGRGKPQPKLISSDLNARELQFISSALDLRNTLVFLARQTGQAKNANLQALGAELEKNLPNQTAVLSTLAEMRSVTIPESSPRQQRIEKKLLTLQGARFEKALLDALLEANQELVDTCEAGQRSNDKSVQQFAEQTLPYARGTLARVQTMAGIAPKRATETPAAAPIGATPKASKPGFRANIQPSGE